MDKANESISTNGEKLPPPRGPLASRREVSFQPDVMLPIQFLRKRNLPAHGERALLTAVLEEAVLCFQKNLHGSSTRQRRLFREAEEWILSDDRSELITFGRICELVGLDPEYVRRGLFEWRERELARLQSESLAMLSANGQHAADLVPIRQVA